MFPPAPRIPLVWECAAAATSSVKSRRHNSITYMAHFTQPRQLKPNERALLEFLLNEDFSGRNELREQVGRIEVVGDCDCGCGTINLMVRSPVVRSVAREPIPV